MGTLPPQCSHNRRNDHHNRDRFRVSGLGFGFGQSSVPGCLVLGEPFLACVRQRTLPVGTTRELVPFWMWAALSLSLSLYVLSALCMFHVMLSDHLLTALQQAAPTRSRHKCRTPALPALDSLHWNIEIAFRSTLRASHIPLDHKSISRLTVSNASPAWVCSSSSFPSSICRACCKKHK